jgi:osmotically-inducible protein OsmY
MPERNSDATDPSGSNATTEPFVGYVSVEDNLAECVKIAIWNAIGEASHGVRVTVAGGIARLDGVVRNDAQRLSAEKASLGIDGIVSVEDHLTIDPTLTPSSSWRALLDEDQDPLACA